MASTFENVLTKFLSAVGAGGTIYYGSQGLKSSIKNGEVQLSQLLIMKKIAKQQLKLAQCMTNLEQGVTSLNQDMSAMALMLKEKYKQQIEMAEKKRKRLVE